MKQKFSLSKTNKTYFGVLAVICFILFLVFSSKTPYRIGKFTGSLICSLLIPSLFAWIVWRLSGRKERGGSLTFNIVLTLILLGQIGQFGNKSQQSPILRDFKTHKEEFKRFLKSDDLENNGYKRYADSIIDILSRLSETSTGSEKQLCKIMSDCVSESYVHAQNWHDSFNAVLSSEILDYSLLNSDEEFDRRINILRLHVENSKANNEFIANLVPNLKKRLKELGEGNKHAEAFVKSATKQSLSKKPILEPLMQAHIEFGKNMIQILELLQKNKDEWTYENDELVIYSESVLNEYNELIEELCNNGATMDTLSTKLAEEK